MEPLNHLSEELLANQSNSESFSNEGAPVSAAVNQGRTFAYGWSETFKSFKQMTSLTRLTHYFFKNALDSTLYGVEQERKNIGEKAQNFLKVLKNRFFLFKNGVTESLWITTSDNKRLEMMSIRACNSDSKKPKSNLDTVIICTGNDHSFEWQAYHMAQAYLDKGFNVVLYNGRGFGASEGKPSEQGSYLDIEAVYQQVKSLWGMPLSDDQILVHGYSLGGGAAIQLAANHPVHLVADRTWARAKDVAVNELKREFPLISKLAAPLLKLIGNVIDAYYRYDNEEKMKQVKGHVFIAHGKEDKIMIGDYAKRLETAYKSVYRDFSSCVRLEVEGGHLHDFCEQIEYEGKPSLGKPWFAYEQPEFDAYLNKIWENRQLIGLSF